MSIKSDKILIKSVNVCTADWVLDSTNIYKCEISNKDNEYVFMSFSVCENTANDDNTVISDRHISATYGFNTIIINSLGKDQGRITLIHKDCVDIVPIPSTNSIEIDKKYNLLAIYKIKHNGYPGFDEFGKQYELVFPDISVEETDTKKIITISSKDTLNAVAFILKDDEDSE